MNRNNLILVVLIAFSSLISCELYSADGEVQVGNKLYVNEDSLDRYWLKSREADPKYPKKESWLKKSACVTIMFTIREDGNVYKSKVVAVYPEKNAHFEKSALKVMKRFWYKPSTTNVDRKEVITTHTFNFIISEGTKRQFRKNWAELEKKFEYVCHVEFEIKKT